MKELKGLKRIEQYVQKIKDEHGIDLSKEARFHHITKTSELYHFVSNISWLEIRINLHFKPVKGRVYWGNTLEEILEQLKANNTSYSIDIEKINTTTILSEQVTHK